MHTQLDTDHSVLRSSSIVLQNLHLYILCYQLIIQQNREKLCDESVLRRNYCEGPLQRKRSTSYNNSHRCCRITLLLFSLSSIYVVKILEKNIDTKLFTIILITALFNLIESFSIKYLKTKGREFFLQEFTKGEKPLQPLMRPLWRRLKTKIVSFNGPPRFVDLKCLRSYTVHRLSLFFNRM